MLQNVPNKKSEIYFFGLWGTRRSCTRLIFRWGITTFSIKSKKIWIEVKIKLGLKTKTVIKKMKPPLTRLVFIFNLFRLKLMQLKCFLALYYMKFQIPHLGPPGTSLVVKKGGGGRGKLSAFFHYLFMDMTRQEPYPPNSIEFHPYKIRSPPIFQQNIPEVCKIFIGSFRVRGSRRGFT